MNYEFQNVHVCRLTIRLPCAVDGDVKIQLLTFQLQRNHKGEEKVAGFYRRFVYTCIHLLKFWISTSATHLDQIKMDIRRKLLACFTR